MKPAPTRMSLPRRAAGTATVVLLTRVERGLPFWPMRRIEWLQRQRLRRIVRHAYETVPFYRETMRRLRLRPGDFEGVEDLAKLPMIDTSMVRGDVERFTSDRSKPSSREALYTSGTESSIRGTVYCDTRNVLRSLVVAERNHAVITSLAGERRSSAELRELVGRDRRNSLLGRLGGADSDHERLSIFPAAFAARTIRSIWHERTLIPARSAHNHEFPAYMSFEEAVERFNEIRPRVVYSFGSYADQFLRFVADRQEQVALPRVWVYGGDMVSPHGFQLAERFGCQLYSIYSAVEAGRLGFQCELRRGHHLNVDFCAVRVVDTDGQTVADGESGDVVVSNLRNTATVLLNYRLGDRGAMATEPCPCGRSLPLLERLEGRRSEVVRLADGRELSSFTLDVMFRSELRSTIQAQIRESEPGLLRWALVPCSDVDRGALRAALLTKAEKLLGADTAVEVEFVDDIPRTAQGKFTNVVREPATERSRVRL
jgi:phenylacetate-coenzyme A ligase PaaK-like adenylate-forming protein